MARAPRTRFLRLRLPPVLPAAPLLLSAVLPDESVSVLLRAGAGPRVPVALWFLAEPELRRRAQLLLDAEEPIVLRDALGSRRRARLDLSRSRRHRQVGDERVLRLARAMRHDGAPARARRQRDRVERLGERADL